MSAPVTVEHGVRTHHAEMRPRTDGTWLLVFREAMRFERAVTIRVNGEACQVAVAADEWCVVRRAGKTPNLATHVGGD